MDYRFGIRLALFVVWPVIATLIMVACLIAVVLAWPFMLHPAAEITFNKTEARGS